jgi:hypothetical protein
MWTWTLNWGEVTPRILVGSCPMRPGDLGRIHAETGVSALLSVQHDACLRYWGIDLQAMHRAARELGLAMARSPMRDFDVHDQRRRLPAAVAALAHLQQRGHRTYVHCTAGLGRAPLTVLAYLTLVEGQDPERAIRSILRARPEAVPSWEAYRGCHHDLVTRHRDAIQKRAHVLYLEGVNGSAEAHWARAEAEVLREQLGGRDPLGEGKVQCDRGDTRR